MHFFHNLTTYLNDSHEQPFRIYIETEGYVFAERASPGVIEASGNDCEGRFSPRVGQPRSSSWGEYIAVRGSLSQRDN